MKKHEDGFLYTHKHTDKTDEGEWTYWYKHKKIVAVYRHNEYDKYPEIGSSK